MRVASLPIAQGRRVTMRALRARRVALDDDEATAQRTTPSTESLLLVTIGAAADAARRGRACGLPAQPEAPQR